MQYINSLYLRATTQNGADNLSDKVKSFGKRAIVKMFDVMLYAIPSPYLNLYLERVVKELKMLPH